MKDSLFGDYFSQVVLRHDLFDAQGQKSVEVAVAEEKILAVVGDAHPDSHLVLCRREVPMTRDKVAVIRAFS